MTVIPEAVQAAYIAPTTRHTRRVAIYEADGITRWSGDDGNRLESGSVSVDNGRDERRAIDLVLNNSNGSLKNAPGKFWYDKIIKAYRGVLIRSANTDQLELWEYQVGEFMIDSISEANFPMQVQVTGRDYAKKCIGSKFRHATQVGGGDKLETIVAAIAGAAGITKRRNLFTEVFVEQTFMFERGVTRWEAMKKMCEAYGYDIFFDREGFLDVQPFTDPVTSSPAYTLRTGPKVGTMASYTKKSTDSDVANVVIVTGEDSGDTIPAYGEAVNNNANSPTSIQKLGERVYEYSSSFITSNSQATALAQQFLKTRGLQDFELNFENLLVPWLDVGTTIRWIDPDPNPGDPDKFLLSSLSIPLDLGTMSGDAKRVAIVG